MADFLDTAFGKKPIKKKISKSPRRNRLAGPWRHDFKNNCVKCNRAYHLQRHHITYDPPLTAFLCETCHKQITKLNTAAALIARTNLKTRPTYTNKIRVIIWRWFLKNKLTKNKHLNIVVKEIITKVGTITKLKKDADIEWSQSTRGCIAKWMRQNCPPPSTTKARSLKVNRALLESNSTKHPLIPSLCIKQPAMQTSGCFDINSPSADSRDVRDLGKIPGGIQCQ